MGDIDHRRGSQGHTRPAFEHADRRIARLAGRQHGVASRGQLLGAGVTARQIDRRIAHGLLHPLHRGVYAVGANVLSQRGVWLAAVLACGPGALLSHRSAAALHGLVRARGPSDVTVGNRRRERPRLRTHHARTLLPADRTLVDRIPATSIPRTLLDLAAVADLHTVRRAFEEAERLRLLRMRELEDLRRRCHGHHGTGRFDAALAAHRAPPEVRSELERLLLELCERGGIPLPAVNVQVGCHLVDCLWTGERVVAELDGWTYHRTRAAHERDHQRTTELELGGYVVLRFTYRQVTEQAERVTARLRQALRSVPARRRDA